MLSLKKIAIGAGMLCVSATLGCAEKEIVPPLKRPKVELVTNVVSRPKPKTEAQKLAELHAFCGYTKTKQTRRNTFPFSKSTRIELVSYANGPLSGHYYSTLIENGRFIGADSLSEQVTLNEAQTDSLFSLLYYRTQDFDTAGIPKMRVAARAAYSPGNAVLFYQGKKVIACLELSFFSDGYESSGPFFGYNGCSRKTCLMIRFFYDVGMKNLYGASYGNCW